MFNISFRRVGRDGPAATSGKRTRASLYVFPFVLLRQSERHLGDHLHNTTLVAVPWVLVITDSEYLFPACVPYASQENILRTCD
jgi:hypothetical protein